MAGHHGPHGAAEHAPSPVRLRYHRRAMVVTLNCTACGAPLHATGRTHRVRCAFCQVDNLLDAATCGQLVLQAPVAPPPVLDRLTSLIATASQDGKAFLAELAKRLEAAVPGRVEVDRKSGLFGGGHVASLTTVLGDYRYTLSLGHHHRVEGKRAHFVRGIVLKTQDLSAADMVSALGAELYEMSIDQPAEVQLEAFLGG